MFSFLSEAHKIKIGAYVFKKPNNKLLKINKKTKHNEFRKH